MRIVAFDTTSDFGSLALWEEDTVLEEVPLYSPEGFSQVLFDALGRSLQRHAWRLHEIDLFAAAAGPGSFTGVRIGLTAAKGLAEATGRSAVAVSNLMALAACGSTAVRAVVMDARRGEIYGAVYDGDLRVLSPESVMPFQKWIEHLPAGVTELLCPDFTPFRQSFPLPVPVAEQRILAAAVARIAAEKMRAGRIEDTAAIDANYVRRSDAELLWRDKS